jgi:hypothetical protein
MGMFLLWHEFSPQSMRRVVDLLLWPFKPMLRHMREQREAQMERVGAAINETLRTIQLVERKKKEVIELQKKRENEVAEEIEGMMDAALPRILASVCRTLNFFP